MTPDAQRHMRTAMAKLHSGAGASLTADEHEALRFYGTDKDQLLLKQQIDPPAPPVAAPAPAVPARETAARFVTEKRYSVLRDALLKHVGTLYDGLRKRDERIADLTTRLQTLEARVLEVEAAHAAQVMHD